MSTDATNVEGAPEQRRVDCKVYHEPKAARNPGRLRSQHDKKSTCPSWAADPVLQQALIDEALEDTRGLHDTFGRPQRLWNAVEGVIFVGKSNNLREPSYNCYLEIPPDGKLFRELQRRRERTRRDVLGQTGGR
jgi:hypothetical protein